MATILSSISSTSEDSKCSFNAKVKGQRGYDSTDYRPIDKTLNCAEFQGSCVSINLPTARPADYRTYKIGAVGYKWLRIRSLIQTNELKINHNRCAGHCLRHQSLNNLYSTSPIRWFSLHSRPDWLYPLVTAAFPPRRNRYSVLQKTNIFCVFIFFLNWILQQI